MKKVFLFVSFIAIAICSFAQEVEKKEKLEGQASEALASVRLANDLVRYGYANKSTLALVEALQIYAENPTRALDAERTGATVDTTKMDGKKEHIDFDYETVLAEAKKMAAGDEYLTALIGNIEADAKGAKRGAVDGPATHYDSVRSGGSDIYNVSFRANELAEILVSGDGDTDLDLYVYDSNGNLIVKDADYTDDCYVRWIPRWTGRFTVKIVNRGKVFNRYVIITN